VVAHYAACDLIHHCMCVQAKGCASVVVRAFVATTSGAVLQRPSDVPADATSLLLCIEVSDDGVGTGLADNVALFRPFYLDNDGASVSCGWRASLHPLRAGPAHWLLIIVCDVVGMIRLCFRAVALRLQSSERWLGNSGAFAIPTRGRAVDGRVRGQARRGRVCEAVTGVAVEPLR
jgi:hypothetical protein